MKACKAKRIVINFSVEIRIRYVYKAAELKRFKELNKQTKRRSRLTPAFPNVDSLPRRLSAICVEISDD